ncbi:MAG: BlaI/MecI/CopY family transcriptional regulator [Ruminococcaceae bacterium]|nr:BlaI/MecI/CopY family transcriptional regulator [Oscillospiraceae bacterium]
MTDLQMGAVESRFADMIWQNEPITASDLAKRAGEMLGWKKTTAYTVLKRLCDKGIFQNDGGAVTSRIARADYYALQSERFVEEQFEGSLPAFLAAFTSRKSLTDQELEALRRMIDVYKED